MTNIIQQVGCLGAYHMHSGCGSDTTRLLVTPLQLFAGHKFVETALAFDNLGQINIPVAPPPKAGEVTQPPTVLPPPLRTVRSLLAPEPAEFEFPQDLFFGSLATCDHIIKENSGTSSGFCGCAMMNDSNPRKPYHYLGTETSIPPVALVDLLKKESGILLGCCNSEPLALRAAMQNHDGVAKGYRWGLCASSV